MYNLFKYYDILQLEEEYKDEFKDINPYSGIAVLPPVLKRYRGGLVLAYLVASQPEGQDHHYGVLRPIGAILRKIKSKRVIRVVNCKREEFAPDKNDFVREYYDLEDHEDWWPNRSTNNEEVYRIALEKMYKTCKTVNIFGNFRHSYYEDYLDTIKKMVSEEYWYFFEALQNNPIRDIDEEIAYQRDLAKKEHAVRAAKRQEKELLETVKARELFVTEIRECMRAFIIKEISPTLKNKPNYAKIDFYRFIGSMMKDIYEDEVKYLNCYNSALNPKAVLANKDNLKEMLKVNMIKTYAKACVKPMNEDENVNNISKLFLRFISTMREQELTATVTNASTNTIERCLDEFKTQIVYIKNAAMKAELQAIYDGLVRDYYETTDSKLLSNVYMGFALAKPSVDCLDDLDNE